VVGEKGLSDTIIDISIAIVLILVTLSCVFPFVHELSLSLSDKVAVGTNKVWVWPVGINLDNYRYMLRDRVILGAIGISVARVVVGVVLNLLLIVVTAYPLSLDRVRMPGRTPFKVFMLFGMLFSGGLIPTFMAIRAYGLLNHFAVLVLPGMLSIFSTIIVMNFFRGIPQELYDAATIDGASHLHILLRVFMPISLPALATVTLFAAVGHWNSWFDGLIYMNTTEKWPLQSYLYTKVIGTALDYNPLQQAKDFGNLTPRGLIAALVFVASAPILMVYPFLQRHFVTGLTLGSVKG
jgi:putative aldouronate transport system permease protein